MFVIIFPLFPIKMASECYLETDAARLPPRNKPEPTNPEQIVEEPDDNEEIKKRSKTTSNVKNKQATTVGKSHYHDFTFYFSL